MPRFDYKTFLELTGGGQGPAQALGTVFGMPSCLVNLGVEALGLLPSPILGAIRGSTANGANRADDVIKAVFSKLRFLHGIIEYDTEDGTFRFVSDSSKSGLDRNEGGFLNNIGGFLGALGQAAGFAGRLYNNYQTTQAQIDSIKDCLQSYKDYSSFAGANSAEQRMALATRSPEQYRELVDQQFGIDRQDLQDALQFKLDALSLIQRIDSLMAARLSNPSLEPQFLPDYSNVLSGTELNFEDPVVIPQVEEVFRLSFGPPKSKQGKFILSVDGLYYDSQTSGIVPALMEIENRKELYDNRFTWKLEADPNIGGRGKQISLEDMKSYVNTILDPNIVDESLFLKQYYDEDNFLLDLIGQKNRRVYDVSAQIRDYTNSGLSQVLISNLRQVMLSETSHHLAKINKRKKQIELAVKMPSIYGRGFSYAPGSVPINDFSYLEGINFQVDIEKQKQLVFNQSEVSGVVLPLQVKYTQQIEHSDPVVLDHLLVANMGFGNIISDSSGLESTNLSLTKSIVTDKLINFYNYLAVGVDSTSSTDYNLRNSSELGKRLNGQLVGTAPSSIFDQGVGIVYLQGITKHAASAPTVPSSVGSYIKLPSEPELQDLLYNLNGATIDTWVHVPELDGENFGFGVDYDVSGLYRLILANENTGLQSNKTAGSNILLMPKDNGLNTVHGFIMGFTRDRRITGDAQPTNLSEDNSVNDACFFLAPTQSFDSSSIGFISKSFESNNNCYTNNGWYNMKFSIWSVVSGTSFSSCGREFSHISVTFSPSENMIKMYCDGQLMAASSYGSVFGISNPLAGLTDIPSLKKNNSFEYNVSSLSATNDANLMNGPKLDPYFTPWILGGGYTDGNPRGNFMGGQWGGIISGLKGYLGSTKFYAKPLSQGEVLDNYNANREFFKNIEVPNLMWEPIINR